MRWTGDRGLGVQALVMLVAAVAGVAVAVAFGWSSWRQTPAVGFAPATTEVPTPTPESVLTLPTPAGLLPRLTPLQGSAEIGTPMPTVSPTAEADLAWQQMQPQLDKAWSVGPGETITLLSGFLDRFPGYPPGKDKLYTALIASADGLAEEGETTAALEELDRAQHLLPERSEAPALTVALTHQTPSADEAQASEQPVVADQPVTAEQPVVADQPVADPPVVAQQPAAADEPQTADEPTANDPPSVADDVAQVVAEAPPPPRPAPPPPRPAPPPPPPPRPAVAPAPPPVAAPTPTKVPFTP